MNTADTIRAARAARGANNPFGLGLAHASEPEPSPITGIDMSAAPKKMPQRANHNHPVLNLDDLEVELGVPMERRQIAGESKWDALFEKKLTKVGMSILVPTLYQGGISAAALKRKKAGLPGVFKLARAGIAKDVKGIEDGTPISRVGRVG